MAGRGNLEAYGALVLRIFLGVIYMAHAYLVIFKIGFPGGLIAFNRSVGIPLPEVAAWYLVLAQGLGGLLLVLGILVRWAALANIPVMVGAIWFVHAGQGFFIFGGKIGYEYTLFLLGATIAQALLGPGAFTLKK
jgi:putative oxidoreductase